MVTQGNVITASDISGLIAKINAEENTRVLGQSDITVVSVGDLITGSKFVEMINRNSYINQSGHCYCEADGGRDAGDTTKTGTILGLSGLTTSYYDRGNYIYASHISGIEADIDNLIAQCDCDTYAETYACTCNVDCDCDNDCSCFGNCDCETHCSSVCTCNTDCTCDDYSCACNIDVCGSCGGHCALVCNCELYCNCEAHCSSVCTCNVDCGNNCDCNSYTNSCGNECDCNTVVCTCEAQCTCQSQCLCQAFCGCDIHCSCDSFKCYIYCEDICTVCVCESNQSFCTCDGICGCNTDCSCDDVCNCDDDCSCFQECDCDKVCSCEYN